MDLGKKKNKAINYYYPEIFYFKSIYITKELLTSRGV